MAQTLTQAIGSVVTNLRAAASLTQAQMAVLIGCRLRTITGIERGEHSSRVDVLEMIARHFGLSLSELIQKAETLRAQNLEETPAGE